MKILIVGGVAGGATAAARIRRLDENAEIIIFERTGFVSYANCGLPYYIGDEIKDERMLRIHTANSLFRRYRIDVRTNSEVIEIDKENKKIKVNNLKDGQNYYEDYDKLILATGAKPIIPGNIDLNIDNIFVLRNVEDTLKIKNYINSDTKRAVIAGGGYIGLEMAENLAKIGIDVIIVQKQNQILAQLDYDMACQVQKYLIKNGIKLILNDGIKSFRNEDNSVVSVLETDKELKSDMVILSVGVTPDTEIAKKAGLELGRKDSIIVNDKMETSEKNIYAVGDAVEIRNFISDEKSLISLAGPANKQGRIVADNVCGISSKYKGAQGTSILKFFDMTIASTGINEKELNRLNMKYEKIIISPLSHASYYPGAQEIVMKVLYEKETLRILGAQIIGLDGVDKRIDILSTAIRAKMKITELQDIDLAYAPPYGSAKDPINMLGYVAENIESDKMKQFYYEDIKELINKEDVILLDVRTENEYNYGHIDNFINMPLDNLREKINEINKSKKVYVMCHSGLRSYIACRILTQNGIECFNFAGGYSFASIINLFNLK